MNKKVKKNYLIVSAVKLLLVTILFIGCKTKNQKPVIISMPSGPDSGYAYVIYNFTTLAADPDGDNIAYQFYWDDSDTSNWSDYIPSDSGFRMTKFWQAGGNYLVRVRAKDENGIKKLREEFGLRSFNKDNFWSTEAVMVMNALVFHNLIHYLNRNIFNSNTPCEHIKTLRSKYFIIPGLLGSEGRNSVLRLGVCNRKLKAKLIYFMERITCISNSLNCNAVYCS